MGEDEFTILLARFKAMLEPYLGRLHVADDRPGIYAVDTEPPETRSPATWFAASRIGKRYVSYYFMPIYADPSMADDLSPALRKRRQGKSCFNLSSVDDALLTGLEDLTARGFAATAGDPAWRPPATSRR